MTGTNARLVFITGATSGIGRATALAFARQGSDLVALGRRKDRLAELAKEAGDVDVTSWVVDVRDRHRLQELAKEHEALLRRVDVIVNNAGLAIGRDVLQETRPEDIDTMVDTNVKGLLYTTRLVLPYMVARGSGHVVNLGSITGRQVYRGGTVYAATKFGVRAITEALRHDVHGSGVRVTGIDPGMVETEFSVVRLGGDAKAAKKVYEGFRPLTSEDIADAIVWAVTRPPHVNIQEILIMPTDQADVTTVHRAAGS